MASVRLLETLALDGSCTSLQQESEPRLGCASSRLALYTFDKKPGMMEATLSSAEVSANPTNFTEDPLILKTGWSLLGQVWIRTQLGLELISLIPSQKGLALFISHN